MRARTLVCCLLVLSVCSCRSEEPAAPTPAPVERKTQMIPDVVRIAVWFVRFEGIEAELTMGSGRVIGQDREAYYVGFQRKTPRPRRALEVVVKVHKKNGFAEWQEY